MWKYMEVCFQDKTLLIKRCFAYAIFLIQLTPTLQILDEKFVSDKFAY